MDKAPRTEKVMSVDEIRDKLQRSKSLVLTNFRGVNVANMTKFRKAMREAGIEYKVVKNTLAKIALHDMGVDGLDTFLEGPTAIAFGIADPVAPAKVITSFMKDVKELEIKAGLLGLDVLKIDGIKALADLPSREVLLARVAGCIASPLTSLASLFSAPIRNVAYGLEAIRKQKEEAAGASPEAVS